MAGLSVARVYRHSGIELLSNPVISRLNRQLINLYAEMALRLKNQSEFELTRRVRAYDNYQRFTFGRGQTKYLRCGDLAKDLNVRAIERLQFDEPDSSYFPGEISEETYSTLNEVLQYSVGAMFDSRTYDADEVLVTLFCHRVIVPPGVTYKGFFHRDLAPEGGRIGTLVWYSQVRASAMDGANLFGYLGDQDESFKELGKRAPDYKFAPAEYNDKLLLMEYPYNYAHGVSPGKNPNPANESHEMLAEFLSPSLKSFVKDLVIVTFSERSPVEH